MTNNRFKDFGAGENLSKEPLKFKLHGEDFECWPNLQGKVLLDLASNTSEDDSAAAAKTMNDFFAAALKPESLARFNSLLEDPERIVTVETLGEITAWLVEEYSSRPTQEPSAS
jgi:hypothetical protein